MKTTLNLLLAATLFTPLPLLAAVLSDEDFTATDGGYTNASVGANALQPWSYATATGSWSTEGDDPGVTSESLTSPAITVPTGRPLRITIVHRYSFEVDWDGGVIQMSVSGGAFTTIPRSAFIKNGYNHNGLLGNHPLNGAVAFNGESADFASGTMITSIAEVPAVTVGSTVAVRILGAWDENTRGMSPNWEVDRVRVETLDDTDGDGMNDLWETEHGLNPASPADRDTDLDADGMTNFREFELRADPQDTDSDDDGLLDGVETGTGIFVSATNRGTSPINADTDSDGLADPVETGTGIFVNAANPGTNPNNADTDGDGFSDSAETLYSTANPNNATSRPLRNGLLDLLAYFPFNDDSDPTQTLDTIKGFVGVLQATTVYTPGGGGRTGAASDKAIDMGSAGAADNGVRVAAAGFLSIAATQNQIAISFWEQLSGTPASSAFWGESPSVGGRGINAHAPWTNNNFYWDTSGCCDGGTQRVNGLSPIDLVAPTAWHHFVFQKNGASKEVWLDGALVVSGSNTAPLPTDFTVLHIASDAGNANIAGLMDDFAVFGDALTPAQIMALAGGASPPSLVPPSTDSDGDGMPNAYETANGLNPGVDDAALDLDGDGSNNLAEFLNNTSPQNPDTDGDGLKDGVETKTGTYVSATNTGTDPLRTDTDADGLSDAVETNSGTYVSPANPGTNPNKADTDGDSWVDLAEIQFGTNPNLATSMPSLSPSGLDLLAWWPFNDSSKPAIATDAVHSIDASLVSGAVFSADAAGRTGGAGDKALDLGTVQGAQAARVISAQWLNLAAPGDQLAVSYWQNLAAVTNSSALWITSPSSNNGQRGFQTHTTWGDGNIYFDTAGCCGGTQRISGPALDITGTAIDLVATWHHFVVQKNGSAKEVWVDGFLTVSGTNTAPLPSDLTNLYIGSGVDSGSMVGLLDDFAIFGDALTEEQIGRLAAGESPTALLGPAPPLGITNVVYNVPTHTIQLTWNSQAGAAYTLEGSLTMATGSWIEINDNISSGGASTQYSYDVNSFPPGGATPVKLFLRVKKN